MRPARCAAVLVAALTVVGSIGATWPPEKFTNLKVLPQDVAPQVLLDTMAGFTRALGVRCTHCHVGQEGQRFSEYDFASDEKETKRKAREMIRMVEDLNGTYLARLERRADPPVRVECATCHRGTTTPRMLEDVVLHAYQTAGLDSGLAAYRGLREQYHGRAIYDFGSVPLTDVAAKLRESGRDDHALRFLELNAEMNPKSVFARRQHAEVAVLQAFRTDGTEAGSRAFRELFERHGAEVFPEFTLNQVGYRLLGENRVAEAVAVFRLNTETYPNSANAFDSLGEAYLKQGDRTRAIQSYEKALSLDPKSESARKQLEGLRKSRRR